MSSSSTATPSPPGTPRNGLLPDRDHAKEPPLSPLMSNLNRLSNATSRPNLPPMLSNNGYAARASRSFSSSFKYWTGVVDDDEEDEEPPTPIDTSFSSTSVDMTKVLYPTLENHPPPLAHPLLVLDLAELTSIPTSVTNDELLSALLRRLEPWVGEDDDGAYCLVILAADDRDLPGKGKSRSLPGVGWWLWNWRRIPRKYRKNLKRLYIVHPSNATKTLLPVVLPMMSPKAYAKLYIVPSLAELTSHGVSLRGMDLSITTLLEEAASTREPPPPSPTAGAIQWGFSALTSAVGVATSYWPGAGSYAKADTEKQDPYWGQDIDDIVADHGGAVPRVMEELGRTIHKQCTDTEGIFRRTGNSPVLSGLRSVLNTPLNLQPKVDWALIAEHDPLLPPTLLKRLLSHLESPIVPESAYAVVRNTRTPVDIRTTFLPALSSGRATLLSHVIHVLHHLLPYEPTTRMGARGLAITLAPTLLRGSDAREDAALCLPPGQSIPGLGVSAAAPNGGVAAQTLTGLLEVWIENHPEVEGSGSSKPCDCGLRGKSVPPSPIKVGDSRRSSAAVPVQSS